MVTHCGQDQVGSWMRLWVQALHQGHGAANRVSSIDTSAGAKTECPDWALANSVPLPLGRTRTSGSGAPWKHAHKRTECPREGSLTRKTLEAGIRFHPRVRSHSAPTAGAMRWSGVSRLLECGGAHVVDTTVGFFSIVRKPGNTDSVLKEPMNHFDGHYWTSAKGRARYLSSQLQSPARPPRPKTWHGPPFVDVAAHLRRECYLAPQSLFVEPPPSVLADAFPPFPA